MHLNGRVYDPLIGRMMTADPMVPDPANGQAWNRYSYVINNPLSFTDPNGYCFLGLCGVFNAIGSFFRAILANIAGHALVGCAMAVASGAKCGPGALAAGVTSFAGPMINGRGFSVASLMANSALGGLAAVAGGGKFANGAVTGAETRLASVRADSPGCHSKPLILLNWDSPARGASSLHAAGPAISPGELPCARWPLLRQSRPCL